MSSDSATFSEASKGPSMPLHYASSKDCAAYSYDKLKELLRSVRDSSVRAPTVVHACVMRLLRDFSGKLGNEIWNYYEEAFLAALDCHQLSDAELCWRKLAGRFTLNSTRVQRLRGLLAECKQDYDIAVQYYNSILEKAHNCDQKTFKRKVAVAKARGDRSDAIATLLEYLKLYQTDGDGYHELADLYLADCQYVKAAGCYEDLILTDPQNYIFMLKYAETLYSTGVKSNLLDARKYFAQSIRLNDTVLNLRAYYGLWITCGSLSSQHGLTGNSENSALQQWAAKKIQEFYATKQSQASMRTLVNQLLLLPSSSSSSSSQK